MKTWNFLAKEYSYHDACIKHLQYSRKAFFSRILASFSMLHDFTIDFFAKEMALMVTFRCLELTFSSNSKLSFWLYSLERNAESAQILDFSINSKDFCQS